MVGAIIGKEGKKIKDLTEKTETEWVSYTVGDDSHSSLGSLRNA